MTNWFSNGERVEQIPISERGFQYGDGLFETVAIRNGEPRFWRFHFDRLVKGCDTIGLSAPTEDILLTGIEHALHHGNALAAYCTVKIIVSAGSGLRGYGRHPVKSPQHWIGIFQSTPPAIELLEDGVDTILCNTRLSHNTAIAGLKTLNRLDQVMARSEVVNRSRFEGLTMDADDNIICGTMSNVFFIAENSIVTPRIDRCGVAGVMRRHVLETLQTEGEQVDEQQIPRDKIARVDEVFVCNSQFGVLPVARCDDRHWGVGPRTREVMQLLAMNGVAECQL